MAKKEILYLGARYKEKLLAKVEKALESNCRELERSQENGEDCAEIYIENDMYEIFIKMIKGTRL